MVIEIKKEVLEKTENRIFFNKLFQDLTYKRRYDIFIDIDDISESEILNRMDYDDLKLIEEYFNNHVTNDRKIDFIVSSQSDINAFNIEEAIRFFNQPVYIILENDFNDEFFIEALINNFKKASKRIRKHKDEIWLKIENAGGANNIPNKINALFKLFPTQSDKKCLRIIVIMDGDKEFPEMEYKQDKLNIISFCEINKISLIILKKREMENYIPDEVLEDIAFNENDDYFEAYLQLNPFQKDYFDIENGFGNKNFNSLSPEIQSFYSEIDVENYKILRKGIQNDKFKGGKFKSEFPKLFQHSKVTQETLLKRTQHQTNKNELQQILSKINELL